MSFSARSIVVPIAHRGETERVIDVAVELAQAFDASVTLLHVSEIPNHMVAIVPGATVDGDVARERAAAEAELDSLVRGIRAQGFERIASAVVIAATIADGIVTWARDNADLIIMGTHGRTGLARLVIGSYAEDVIRLAPCPVMTIHLP